MCRLFRFASGRGAPFATSQDGERRKPGPAEIHPGSRVAASILFLATVSTAVLDVGRFHWIQPVTLTAKAYALVVVIFAAGLQVWAMAANSFFSTAIRVQDERGHETVTRGPYRYIRHPGYLAMAVMMPATAVAIGSLVALLPALLYSTLILWRLQQEDRFLKENLERYSDYAGAVRSRIIPGLW